MTTIVWFRHDLRTADNPALWQAARQGQILPVYIFDDTTTRPLGGASRWWLHHSLAALDESLGGLVLLRGDALDCLRTVIEDSGAERVYWNRCYEPEAISRDTIIKFELRAQGLEVASFNASLLHEPWEVQTLSGGPYKVYSPYWRAVRRLPKPKPLDGPKLENVSVPAMGDRLSDWDLLPRNPDWADGWDKVWTPSEAGAAARLDGFLSNGLEGYGTLRDRPDLENVSRLSPHLRFGEISPRQVWARTRFVADSDPRHQKDAEKFLSEITWREFSYHLLFHYPTLATENWRPAFDAYPWRESARELAAWQRGETGFPIVDAGMRELWHTGYMHNRVRMLTASFLVKHLRLHWRHGEAWFWDTLVDADMANNAAGWQWVAGSGADSSPYFRIFNPVAQGRKFDPDGSYVRRWCPELVDLDSSVIHAPFEASESQLDKAGVRLGQTYPRPIVNHAEARHKALSGYENVKLAKQNTAT